jgi:hypothetical protein
MAEVVNLRRARKQMKRKQEASRAEQNRLMHGRPRAERQLAEARAEKAMRKLDAHLLPPRGTV